MLLLLLLQRFVLLVGDLLRLTVLGPWQSQSQPSVFCVRVFVVLC